VKIKFRMGVPRNIRRALLIAWLALVRLRGRRGRKEDRP